MDSLAVKSFENEKVVPKKYFLSYEWTGSKVDWFFGVKKSSELLFMLVCLLHYFRMKLPSGVHYFSNCTADGTYKTA
jgi:hypothetical protein